MFQELTPLRVPWVDGSVYRRHRRPFVGELCHIGFPLVSSAASGSMILEVGLLALWTAVQRALALPAFAERLAISLGG